MQTVFLSSTYLDLQPERSAVRDAILRLQCRFFGMEYFGSDPERPLKVSLDLVSRSTIYVGIVAHRYGVIDRETQQSITQLEYEAAKQRGIPTLVYIKSSTTLIEPTSQYIDFDAEQRRRLLQFTEELKESGLVQWFVDPSDLAAKVTADIARLMIEMKSLQDPLEIEENDGGLQSKWRRDGSAFTIPLIGPVAAGKTVYGCMLTHEPAATLYRRGFTIEIDPSESAFSHCYDCLRAGRWAPKTSQWSREGLEFVLRQQEGPSYTIRLADTSGDSLYDTFDPEYHTGYHRQYFSILPLLSESSAIALIVPVREDRLGYFDGVDSLCANLLGVLGRSSASGVFSRPVAIIISKSDLAPNLSNACCEEDDYFATAYPLTSAQLHHRLSIYRIFSASAVGSVDRTGNPASLGPKGIWDPILWLANSVKEENVAPNPSAAPDVNRAPRGRHR